ncbi:MAG: type II toxin-antitoxin system RelB/DinJ family antitoxin [Patescibacteria group bacterium]|nr:type II toxin-antitoxin system RelB/DinJ family antitoxin [Patescibacteria group bacterium]
MPKSAIYLKTDTSLKQEAHKKADELGLTLSAVINIMLREFVQGRDLRIRVDGEDAPQKSQPRPPIRLA